VVVDDEAVLVVRWNGFSQLLESLGGSRMGRRVEVYQSQGSVLHHNKHVEDSKGGGHCYAEVTGDDRPSVILQKSRPARLTPRAPVFVIF
jgi:hypothetical protein